MLPLTKQERKKRPMDRGCLQYFPDALAYVSHVSYVGNEQHNPGEPMHWAKEKSSDHGDCIIRHQADAGTTDDDGLLHSGKVAWRALAQLQIELEQRAPDESDRVAVLDASIKDNISRLDTPWTFGSATEAAIRAGNPDRTAVSATEAALLGGDAGIVAAVTASRAEQLRGSIVDPNTWTLPKAAEPPTVNGVPIRHDPTLHNHELYFIDLSAWDLICIPQPRVYIAGPMRGIRDFNFPAFDQARDKLKAEGWDVISPADLDREAPTQATTDEEAGSEERVHEYMSRDLTDTLLTFRKSRGDAIAMLPGWENSTGAVTEFMVARWAGLRILDAVTGELLTNFDARLLARAIADHLHFVNQ